MSEAMRAAAELAAIPRAGLALPEQKWTYRRTFTFVVAVLFAGLMTQLIGKLDDPKALQAVAFFLCGILVIQQILYMVGPTIDQIQRILATVEGWKLFGLRGGS